MSAPDDTYGRVEFLPSAHEANARFWQSYADTLRAERDALAARVERLEGLLDRVEGRFGSWITAVGDWDMGGPEAIDEMHEMGDEIRAALSTDAQ
jgi:hypothetical protein